MYRRPQTSTLTDSPLPYATLFRSPDLVLVLVMLVLLGTFGFNFAIFISTMSVTEFDGDASQYGLLTSAMAVGTMSGALLSARRPVPGVVLMADRKSTRLNSSH